MRVRYVLYLVQTTPLTPLSHYSQLTLLGYTPHEQQHIDMPTR